MRNAKGFTLIEVLMVIAVIGLLSAAAIYSLNTVKGRARDAVRSADVDQLSKALDLYSNTNGSYPIQDTPICLDGSDPVSAALQSGGLIAKPFKDPIFTDSEKCYRYTTDPDGTSYTIRYFYETGSVADPGYHTAPF